MSQEWIRLREMAIDAVESHDWMHLTRSEALLQGLFEMVVAIGNRIDEMDVARQSAKAEVHHEVESRTS